MADELGNPDPRAPGSRADFSAEKAYAAAAEAIPVKAKPEEQSMPDTETAEATPPVEATMDAADPIVVTPEPAPAKPARKPRVAKAAAPVAEATAPVKVRKKPGPKPGSTRTPKAAKPAAAKPVGPKAAVAKPVKAAKAGKPAVAAKAALIKPKPAIKPAAQKAAFVAAQAKPQLKERTMEMKSKIESVISDVQDKAKAAYEKSAELFGEAGEFTKGNVEAVVESGKILAAGLQDMGTSMVADTKDSFETMTADVKALAAVKSPTELVKLQSDIMRRNFDKAVAYGSKNSEAMLKLANDMFAPISGRFSLAMDKVRQAA